MKSLFCPECRRAVAYSTNADVLTLVARVHRGFCSCLAKKPAEADVLATPSTRSDKS